VSLTETSTGRECPSVNRPLALLRHLLRLAHEEWETIARARRDRGGAAEVVEVVGSPGWSRTSDFLINRRGSVMSRPSMLFAQLRVTARSS
jgi:hypothetical protein